MSICRTTLIILLVLGLCSDRLAADSRAPEASDSAENSPQEESIRIEGLSLDEWRERMKNLNLESAQAAEAVPGLMKIIDNPKIPSFTRRQAALTLGRIGKPAHQSIPLLIDLLEKANQADPQKTDEGGTSLWAVKALALFGPAAKDAAPLLIQRMQNTSLPIDERIVPLEALSQIGPAHPQIIPALVQTLQSTQRSNSNDAKDEKIGEIRVGIIETLTVIGPAATPAIPALIRATRDQREPVRRAAMAALGAMGGNAQIALSALGEAVIFDQSEAVRDAAADALANIGPPAVPVLIRLLKHEYPQVRWRAAQSLGTMGRRAQAASQTLSNLMQDSHNRTRIAAIEAHWKINQDADKVVPALVQELTCEDRQIRIQAFRLLVGLGPEARQAVPQLKKLQQDQRSYVRRAAREALDKIAKKNSDQQTE